MIKERRKHARLRIPIEAEYQVAGEDVWRQGTIWMLGAGGAGLLCHEKLDKGTYLEGLRFVVEAEGDLPETRIEVGAEVVNVEREGDFGCRSCFMLGLRFEGLAEDEFELLRQFVFRRLTAAGSRSAGAALDTTGAPPIEIRFKLFEEFVAEVSDNLSLSGMFIRAHRPLPPGSKFAFRFQLGDDFPLLQGTAEVVWTRRRIEGPERPPGMGVRFLKLDLTSQKMVRRLVDQRQAQQDGAAGAAVPAPEAPDPEAPDPEAPDAKASGPRDSSADDTSGAEAARLEEPAERPAEQDDPTPELKALDEAEAQAQPPAAGAAGTAESDSPEDAAQAAAGDEAPSEPQAAAAAEAVVARARERLTRLAAEAAGLREELRGERAARLTAEEARERAESETAELRSELDGAARRAREEIARRRAEWSALETELRERLDRSEAQRDELHRLAERAEAAEGDLEELQRESDEARRESEALEAELRAQLERQGAERADLEDRLSAADGAAAELRRRVAELEEQAATSAKVEAALREQAQELRAAPAELEDRLRRVSGQLRGLRDAAAGLTGDDLDAARALDGEMERRLAEVAAAGAGLREKIGGLIEARGDLTERLTRIAESWSGLEEGLAAADGEELELDTAPAPVDQQTAEAPVDVTVEAPLVEAAPVEAAPDETPVELPAEMSVESPVELEPEPSAAARLVGAARRAAARLGLGGSASAGGNGSALEGAAVGEAVAEPEPEPAGSAAGSGDSASAAGGNGAAAIEETVRAWAAAWAEQRVEDYLSFYSRDFEPGQAAADGGDGGNGETAKAWLPPLAGMQLTLGPISHTELSPGRIAVQFEQQVASDSYARRTGRTLELVRESDAWKIAAESFQEL